MKKKLFAGKSARTKIFTIITACLIVLLIALNFLVNYFSVFGTAYIDMTPEGLYTLRPQMVDACAEIFLDEQGNPGDIEVKMIFCNDPDNLLSNLVSRTVYFMALALEQKFDNFSVETVNVRYNPTAVAAYKTTSLSEITQNDVIIACGSRYRIVDADNFWRISGDDLYSFDGEFKLASILMSLTLVNKPSAYFVTDHGEEYYDPQDPESEMSRSMGYLADLLGEKGLGIKTISLSDTIAQAEQEGKTPVLPEDCVLLIINDPKTDFTYDEDKLTSFYYVSETELLDRYMTSGKGSIMVAKDYRIDLPVFEDFLAEWGIEFSDTLVKDTEHAITTDGSEQGVTLVGEYNKNENSYAYGIYGDYAALSTSPRMVVSNTGHIICSFDDSKGLNESGTYTVSRAFASFLTTSSTALDYAKNSISGEYVDRASQFSKAYTVAAISGREHLNPVTGETTSSYIFCAASADFFSEKLLGNSSYANYDIVAATVHDISRLDTYADMSLGGISVNNYTGFGGKPLVETDMFDKDKEVYKYHEDGKTEIIKINRGLSDGMKIFYSVVAAVIPLSIAVVGVIVCAKRKYK